MNQIVVDYETFYDTKRKISVTEQAVRNYVAGTDAYILAIVGDDIPGCNGYGEWVGTIEQTREQFPHAFWTDPANQFYAANSVFDESWNEKYFPVTAKPWECLLDMGVFHQIGRSLPQLAKNVLGVKVDKAVRTEMDGVDYFALPDEQQQKVNEYCLNDSVQEYRILKAIKPMSATEQKIAALTRKQNRRGVHIDLDRVDGDKTRLAELKHAAFLKIPWRDQEAALSPDALSDWCAANKIPCPQSVDKNNAQCTELMRQHPKLAEIIVNLRRYRSVNTLFQKAQTLLARVHEGVLPLELLYCGAPHTRRWSSKGFNVQNLPKEPIVISGPWDVARLTDAISKGETIPEEVHYIWLRNWLVPKPGDIFLIFDYAQIEPRALNWLAGNEEMLAGLRTGFSYYEAYARAAKGWKGAPGTLKKEFGLARYTKLKNECLGCGYGMGASKYTTYANVTKEEAEVIVKGFRATNPLICKMWRKLDHLIVTAARDSSHVLEVELPTGDKLIHWDVRCANNSYRSITTKGDYSQQSIQSRLWGGTLTENVTQRCARDIMADAMVRLEAAGIPVIFSAHDEVILSVPDDNNKQAAMDEAERILSTPPDWCPDLPLAVEGGFAKMYLK